MTETLALALVLPLGGALLTVVLPGQAARLGLLAVALNTLNTALLTLGVWQQGALHADFGGWGAPLGIGFVADGLSTAMLAMTALVTLVISINAADYFRDPARARHFWPLWLLLLTSLNGLFLSADLFNLYVNLELLGLTAAALGALGGQRAALEANLRYLLVGLLGSMTYLLGVALVYSGFATLDFALLTERLTAGLAEGQMPSPIAATALGLMVLGLALKAALFPLHFWLPPAHGSAPAPVSAALSALVVKAAFYLILRLWLLVFAPVTTQGAANLLGLLGAGAVLWGSWQALRAERLKLLAAYSTVAQLGYLFVFFPIMQALPAGDARDNLLVALALMAITHGFAKSGFFLAAGFMQKQAGHDRIADLGATMQRLPATTLTLALAGMALIGLPPSGNFTAKWLLLGGAFATGQWWWVLVLFAGTLLAVAYVFRLLTQAFGLEPTPRRFFTQAGAEVPALLLAVMAVGVLGLTTAPLWRLLGVTGGAS
ncbi:complex I subunit 5 family protein [Thiorhodovibrio frisius]|uniref:Formate hydrogenlyase subunit 3/multisubunit Na+/H+ antiporter, MnhD subunit n=1 Tax=Thiorhodovibrio frisius TaxID=631362 RepID=H8Z241_9GAMM|nr:proton-conducting transporter membrane subunit [Thiorhodovibrio frisius]EIC21566.1 formate hydrogenlyase subunit 3/multisubunit Na+/H+ antiporter, MnhD subunit [Thiorhodovibrio frisius]WPL24150.1 Multiple resistance and pH homeostasis protein D [Thiorhodovibrio frisius]